MPESGHPHYRDLQVRFSGRGGICRLALAHLQFHLYDGAPGLGHRGVQQGAEELYGYGVRKLQYGESKCHSSCFQ